MIERYQGAGNRHRLIEALRAQAIIRDDEHLANTLADEIQLIEFEPNERAITQDHFDDDLYFILAGRMSIVVNRREVAIRHAGEHVGEMSLIDPAGARSASVIALEKTIAGRITESAFTKIADIFPRLWRLIALHLCIRLRQRNDLITQPNPRPVVFVASSVESLSIAREIQSGLRHDDFVVRLWTDKVFGASRYPIEDIETQVKMSDFALIVLGPDDRVASRGNQFDAPRDNVIFELGMFLGAISRYRTFVLRPRGLDIKIPSDLLGLAVLDYPEGAPEDLPSRLGPVCNDLRIIVSRLGPK